MTLADWIICVVVLLNVVTAAMQGFFSEALSMAGLVVGYIVAAWKYRSLAEWFEKFLKNDWLAEILGFLIIFFAILLLFGLAARLARWVMKQSGLSSFDRFLGAIGTAEGRIDGSRNPDGHDGIRANFQDAAEFATGALFPGRWAGCDLGGSGRIARSFLSGFGFASSSCAEVLRLSCFPAALGHGAVKKFIAKREMHREGSTGSAHFTNVPKQHSLF